MKGMQFSIQIRTPKEAVWKTLWEDKTFRDWGSVIDDGLYLVGDMREGNEVQFISSVSGYGVTSLIERLIPNAFVSFRQMADTRDSGKQDREKEWTGSTESYSIAENDNITTLTITIDVPPEHEDAFKMRMPKALQRVKELAEGFD